jgi:hypothetical protein
LPLDPEPPPAPEPPPEPPEPEPPPEPLPEPPPDAWPSPAPEEPDPPPEPASGDADPDDALSPAFALPEPLSGAASRGGPAVEPEEESDPFEEAPLRSTFAAAAASEPETIESRAVRFGRGDTRTALDADGPVERASTAAISARVGMIANALVSRIDIAARSACGASGPRRRG